MNSFALKSERTKSMARSLDQPLLVSVDASKKPETKADDDRMLYLLFLILGVGSVLPSFVLGSAIDYFTSATPSGDIEFQLNAWCNLMLFVASVLNALYLQRLGFTLRIVWGFVAMGVCMVLVPVLDRTRDAYMAQFPAMLVAIAAVLGVADAFAQCSLYGLTSAAFPPVYTQALMMGVALCGTLISLARMACKLLTDDLRASSYAFFLSAGAYSLLSAALYWR